MYLTNEVTLFYITTAHTGAIMLIMLYSRYILRELRRTKTKAEQTCAHLNILFVFQLGFHAVSTFFLMWHDYWILATTDLLLFGWRFLELYLNKWNVYDPTKILLPRGEINKRRFHNNFTMLYMLVCMCIFIARMDQEYKLINWFIFRHSGFLWFILRYAYILTLTHALITVVVYSLMVFASLELADSLSEWLDLCAKLNKSLPVKLILHGTLSGLLIGYGYWIPLLANVPLLVFEIIEIVEPKMGNMGVYNPMEMGDPERFSDCKKFCRVQLHFFCAFLLVYILAMMFDVFGIPMKIPPTQRNIIAVICGLAHMVIPFINYMILLLLRRYPQAGVDPYDCCFLLNTLHTINAMLHLHFCGLLLAQSQWFLFCANTLVFIVEVKEMINEREKTFRIYRPANISNYWQLGKLMRRNAILLFLFGVLLIFDFIGILFMPKVTALLKVLKQAKVWILAILLSFF